MTEPEVYETIFSLLSEAELAARNHQWPTCGTACRKAMEIAFNPPIDNKEKTDDFNKTPRN